MDKEKLLMIKKYIEDNYIPYNGPICGCDSKIDSIGKFDLEALRKRVNKNISYSWQQSLFDYIDEKGMSEVEVYKRADISKQVFSKIRSNESYHPDKDTAICLCIGLRLNIDETIDLLSKAGYTLSSSIERDLIIRYFIENNEYNMLEINEILYDMNLKTFSKK